MRVGETADPGRRQTWGPGKSCKGICLVGVEEYKGILLSKEMQ